MSHESHQPGAQPAEKGLQGLCPEVTPPSCSPALLPLPGPLPACSRRQPAYPSPPLYLQLLDFRWGGHLLVLRLRPPPAAKLTVLIRLLALCPGVVVLADGGRARKLCPWGRARVTPALPPPTPSPPAPAPALPAQTWRPRSPEFPAAGTGGPRGPWAQGAGGSPIPTLPDPSPARSPCLYAA